MLNNVHSDTGNKYFVNKQQLISKMPSRENMYLLASGSGTMNGSVPEFRISTLQVEELVSEIKENLRLSNSSVKSSRSYLSRKSSRASPYQIPNRCSSNCDKEKKGSCAECVPKRRYLKSSLQEQSENLDDPYELLQKLLRDGGLVQEAVRRVQLGLTPKQRYFYDSEEDTCSPIIRFHDAPSAKCN